MRLAAACALQVYNTLHCNMYMRVELEGASGGAP